MNALCNPAYVGIFRLIARLWLGYAWLTAASGKVVGEDSAVWVGDQAGVAVTGFLQGPSTDPFWPRTLTPHIRATGGAGSACCLSTRTRSITSGSTASGNGTICSAAPAAPTAAHPSVGVRCDVSGPHVGL